MIREKQVENNCLSMEPSTISEQYFPQVPSINLSAFLCLSILLYKDKDNSRHSPTSLGNEWFRWLSSTSLSFIRNIRCAMQQLTSVRKLSSLNGAGFQGCGQGKACERAWTRKLGLSCTRKKGLQMWAWNSTKIPKNYCVSCAHNLMPNWHAPLAHPNPSFPEDVIPSLILSADGLHLHKWKAQFRSTQIFPTKLQLLDAVGCWPLTCKAFALNAQIFYHKKETTPVTLQAPWVQASCEPESLCSRKCSQYFWAHRTGLELTYCAKTDAELSGIKAVGHIWIGASPRHIWASQCRPFLTSTHLENFFVTLLKPNHVTLQLSTPLIL